jgi:rhodanese-related sulfurtransferase
MKLFSMSLLTLALSAPAAALACQGAKATTAGYGTGTCGEATVTAGTCDGVQQISIGQLAALKTAEQPMTVYDANRDATRAKFGMVPGAKKLSSYKDYKIDKELPKDRSALLVFYCANEKCSAAPKAAQRAWDAGFTNVYVMHAGIMGWTEAGQPVSKPSA